MWCGICYYAAEDKIFSLTKPQEEEGFDFTQSEDKQRHLKARYGDNLMVPFQCNLCRFRDLTQRDLGLLDSDIRLVVSIHRANTDAFWARELGTVGATRREGLVSIRSGRF